MYRKKPSNCLYGPLQGPHGVYGVLPGHLKAAKTSTPDPTNQNQCSSGYLLPEASEVQISQNFNAQGQILLRIRKVDPMKYMWLE